MELHDQSDDGRAPHLISLWDDAGCSGPVDLFQVEAGSEIACQPGLTDNWSRLPRFEQPSFAPQPWEGYAVRVVARLCQACCAPLDDGAQTCPMCGAAQSAAQPGWRPAPAAHNRVTAALLAIGLGAFGAHKFYLGQPKIGLAYLLLCWTLIPGLIGLIEGLVYLFQTDKQFSTRYP